MIRIAAGAAMTALVLAAAPAGAERSPQEVVDAVVELSAEVPADARTVESLGGRRSGNGVVIDQAGLVLTIGYLILEAAEVSIETRDGRSLPAEPIAYDHATGFGLVRALTALEVAPLPLGASSDMGEGAYALVVASGGAAMVNAVRVVGRRDFAGYWEYLMEDAIFTAPFTPAFAGAALINERGELMGIGSLAVAEAAEPGTYMPGNMFVPIDALKPILADLLEHGRSAGPHQPWLGIYTDASGEAVRVASVAADGPAASAGLREGDVITEVGGEPVADRQAFYRKVWALGEAGVAVPLTVRRGAETLELTVTSGDRYDWLKLKRTY